MPLDQTLLTITALNYANFQSPTGFVDIRTGQTVQGGGLYQGKYFDITETEALNLSSFAPGLTRLYAGRYRFVQVDPNATQANVNTGLVCFYAPGPSVQWAVTLTPGSGQTPGTYTIAATGGGGTGAAIQVVVSAAGTVITQPYVVNGGSGYTTTPAFILTGVGGTAATFMGQMSVKFNVVTSADKATSPNQPRGVFLNAVTPGNYGFIQELGICSVLGAATVGSSTTGAFVNATGNGTVVTTVGTGNPVGATVAQAFDLPVSSALFRSIMILPTVQG